MSHDDVQTNGQIVVSDFGCPDFGDAEVYLTNSTPIDLGGCSSYQDLFDVGWGADIDTSSKPPVKLPPTGYNTLKGNTLGLRLHKNVRKHVRNYNWHFRITFIFYTFSRSHRTFYVRIILKRNTPDKKRVVQCKLYKFLILA